MHSDIQNSMGSSKQSPEGQVARAKALERDRDWTGAIDAYLAITTQDSADLDFLEGVSCLCCCRAKGSSCQSALLMKGYLRGQLV